MPYAICHITYAIEWPLKNKCDNTYSAAVAAIELSPALKSRAKLIRSLRDQENVYRIYFSKTINMACE
jgi:hypothetical protein